MLLRRELLWSNITETAIGAYMVGGRREELTDPVTEVTVRGQPRRMLSSILQMALAFNANRAERTRLGHDCGVFALACATGDAFDGRSFKPIDHDLQVRMILESPLVAHGEEPTEPLTTLGEILYLDPPTEGLHAGTHVMIRASEEYEGERALYASKLNAAGPVVLHTFKAGLDCYPAGAISRVQLFAAAR